MTATLHPTEAGLLRDIVERPGDDTPRLILADWLQDHGHEARGEYVRLGVEHARLPDDERPLQGRRILARMEAILDDTPWGHGWWADMPSWVVESWTDRGFVGMASCTCEDWLKHGPALVLRQPITAVRITDREPESPSFSFLRRHFWGGHGGSALVRRPGSRWVGTQLWRALAETRWNDDRKRWENPGYKTPEDAHAALSRACVAWAREQAKLPPLEATPPD